MYGQQPLLAQQSSLSAALASSETRPCPCCPTSPFIYNRFIGGYSITLILQWLSLIFLVAGTATPALFVVLSPSFTITYGLFHACVVTAPARVCYSYQSDNGAKLGSSHLGLEWSAYQGLSVTLCILTFAISVLFTLRMVVVQRSKSLTRRTELALVGVAAVVLVLAVVAVSLFIDCYRSVQWQLGIKTLGSSFTLTVAAYILQLSGLLFHCYTYFRHTQASGGSIAAASIPVRAGEPEPVPMSVVPGHEPYSHSYTPAAAAAYMQPPAFYGQAYQLPHQYQPPQGGLMPSYYSPPQYYAPVQPPHMAAFAHPQPYPPPSAVHYGEGAAAQQQPAAATPQ